MFFQDIYNTLSVMACERVMIKYIPCLLFVSIREISFYNTMNGEDDTRENEKREEDKTARRKRKKRRKTE